MGTTNQERHEMIIDFLSQFSTYQYSGRPALPKVPKPLSEIKNIDTNVINQAVKAFTDVLNINSGSAGDVNFYTLLQAYITVPEFRDRFNKLAREALIWSVDQKNKG